MISHPTKFDKFQPLVIPLKSGGKLFFYLKKYKKSQTNELLAQDQLNLYNIFQTKTKLIKNEKQDDQQQLNGSKTNHQNQQQKEQSNLQYFQNVVIPENRTVFVINLEKPFEQEKLKKLFKMNGKVGKVFVGSYQKKGAKKNQNNNGSKIPKTIYFALVIFKMERYFLRCMDVEDFQFRINQKYKQMRKHQDEYGNEKYMQKLIENYGEKDNEEIVQKKHQKQVMEDDGFTMVLNKQGDFQIEDEEFKEQQKQKKIKKDTETYVRKRNKNQLEQNKFYKFQIKSALLQKQLAGIDGEEENFEGMTQKEIISMRKKKLLQKFEKDKEMLKQKQFIKTENSTLNKIEEDNDDDDNEDI